MRLFTINDPPDNPTLATVTKTTAPAGDLDLQHKETNIVLVPFWIDRAFKRNGFSYTELSNYDKLSTLLSIEDIAQFVACNIDSNLTHLYGLQRNGYLLDMWERHQQFKSDINQNVLLRLASLPEILFDLQQRLSHDMGTESPVDPTGLYSVNIGVDNIIYIVLQAGILNYLSQPDGRKTFYRDVLKALYSLQPIHLVSMRYDVFKGYVALL